MIDKIQSVIEGIEKWQDEHKTHHHAFYVSMIKADLKGILFEEDTPPKLTANNK